MTRKTAGHFGPSRRTEVTYSRTFVMYLVPFACVVSAAAAAALAWVIVGFTRADGEMLITGGVAFFLSLPLVAVGWWNARRALRDRRIQKKQLGSWRDRT